MLYVNESYDITFINFQIWLFQKEGVDACEILVISLCTVYCLNFSMSVDHSVTHK